MAKNIYKVLEEVEFKDEKYEVGAELELTEKQAEKLEGKVELVVPKDGEAPELYTHVDRADGKYYRESELNPEKPHIGPESNQATVERMTEDEAREANK